jgi:Nucleoside-diphosphate-sugar epimerases
MNFFVTGATGKVGSRFVPRLLQRGHKVKLLVRAGQMQIGFTN